MAVFFITNPASPAEHKALVAQAVQEHGRVLKIGESGWLVASNGTARELSDKLGITGTLSTDPNGTALPIARYPTVVFHVANYFGRGNPEWWEWMKSNWESTRG